MRSGEQASCPIHSGFDPLSPAFLADPFAILNSLAGEPPQGAKLFLWLAASGRDASVFPEPETFDLRRANATKTLAFGRGSTIASAQRSDFEAEIALIALTIRCPRLRLVGGQELSFHPNISFRGPEALWVVCRPR